jgi:hypothetical protein
MSTSDAEIPSKKKRIESPVKKHNHVVAKRLKRAKARDAASLERRLQVAREVRKQKLERERMDPEELKRLEELAETERKAAAALLRKRQRAASPSTVVINNAKGNAKRLKGDEKKAAAETKRLAEEAQPKIIRDRAKNILSREKKKLDFHQRLIFILKHTTTTNHLSEVENAMKEIITITGLESGLLARYLLELGVVSALFGCLRRFPTEEWFHLLSLQVLSGSLKAMHERTDLTESDSPILRATYDQLLDQNACDFIVLIAEKHSIHLDVVQECMEVLHLLVRNYDHDYRPPTSSCFLESFSNRNVGGVCRHPRIEALVVRLFNQHEIHSATDEFAQHCLGLIVVFASNDKSASYRPEMCDIVMKSMQKYAENNVVV